MIDNPWPDFTRGNRQTIRKILIEWGSGIAERTDGMIKFDVETTPSLTGSIKHRCRLQLVPIRYSYPLFTVTQHGINQFPVTVETDVLDGPVNSANQTEFEDILKQIISSESTRNVVEQMLDAAS